MDSELESRLKQTLGLSGLVTSSLNTVLNDLMKSKQDGLTAQQQNSLPTTPRKVGEYTFLLPSYLKLPGEISSQQLAVTFMVYKTMDGQQVDCSFLATDSDKYAACWLERSK